MNGSYDLIVIGSGSIGVPVALEFVKKGHSVLVIDSLPSPGQGQNKKAIGGIRATHFNKGLIKVCQRSIEIFSHWKATYGQDIHWQNNGYSFPAYTEEDEKLLKATIELQKRVGLNITWLSPEEYKELNPGINMEGLFGSTYSPEDGSASPILFIHSAYSKAVEFGARFRFNETVIGFKLKGKKVASVKTDKGNYESSYVLNAAGANAEAISQMAEINISVDCNSNEAGISEPVKRFMKPMIVDTRKEADSECLYFYQNKEGQVVFCMTPRPPMWGIDDRSISTFLPAIAKRMIGIMPTLANLKVRRTWRGQFPVTPNGLPIIGRTNRLVNFFQAVGTSGVGFMLGPGMAELLYRIVTHSHTPDDEEILTAFQLPDDFSR